MPIIRNFLSRNRPVGEAPAQDEPRQVSTDKPTRPSIDVKQPVEYKLSEINEGGVYLPPSPTETKSFWSTRSSASTATSNHRSVFNENEPFNISRESFDSYRRSFDISARSPVHEILSQHQPRQSLDSRRVLSPRLSLNYNRPSIDKADAEREQEGFKDVDLSEEKPAQQTKRRSIFSRFGGDSEQPNSLSGENSRPSSSHHFGLSFGGGRKRGQSGQGAELRSMNRGENLSPAPSPMATEVKVDS